MAGGVVSAPPNAELLGSVAEIRGAPLLLVLSPFFSFTVELSTPQVCSERAAGRAHLVRVGGALGTTSSCPPSCPERLSCLPLPERLLRPTAGLGRALTPHHPS